MPSSLNVPKGITRGKWGEYYGTPTAAQTYVPGDWVIIGTSGTLEIAAASANDVDASAVQILGISMHSAADVLALPSTPFERRLGMVAIPLDAGSQFLSAIYHATAASAVLAETAIDVPTVLPLRNQGGLWCGSLANDGTDDCIQFDEKYHLHIYTDTYPWWWAHVVRTEMFGT